MRAEERSPDQEESERSPSSHVEEEGDEEAASGDDRVEEEEEEGENEAGEREASPVAQNSSRRKSRSRSRSRERRSSRRRRTRSRSRSHSSHHRRPRTRSRSRTPDYDRRGSGGGYGYRRSRSRSPYGRRGGGGIGGGARAPKMLSTLQENAPPNRCIGVFGLSLYTTERDLKDYFSKFGPIEDIQLVFDHPTGRSRGFGFIYFVNIEDAIDAKEQAPGTELDGHRIRVDFSATKRAHTPTPGIYMGRASYSGGGGSRRERDDYRERSPMGYNGGGGYGRRRSYSPRGDYY